MLQGGKSSSVFVMSMSTKLPIEWEKENDFSTVACVPPPFDKASQKYLKKYFYSAKNDVPWIFPVTKIDATLCFFSHVFLSFVELQ